MEYDEAQIRRDYEAYRARCKSYGTRAESFSAYCHDWIETAEAEERCKNNPTCCAQAKALATGVTDDDGLAKLLQRVMSEEEEEVPRSLSEPPATS